MQKTAIFLTVFSLNLLSNVSSAEVKPAGTIELNLCGNLNRSTEICVGQALGSERSYLVLTGFGYRNETLKGIYQKADVKTDMRVGASSTSYTAMIARLEGNYIVETEYKLVVRQVVVPDAVPTGQLYINGTLHGPSFEMEQIAHTQ